MDLNELLVTAFQVLNHLGAVINLINGVIALYRNLTQLLGRKVSSNGPKSR